MDVMNVFGQSVDTPVPPTDVTSLTRTVAAVSRALDLDPSDAVMTMARPLVGGVMPDVNLRGLEALAAAGNARVRVLIEVDGGPTLDLVHLI